MKMNGISFRNWFDLVEKKLKLFMNSKLISVNGTKLLFKYTKTKNFYTKYLHSKLKRTTQRVMNLHESTSTTHKIVIYVLKIAKLLIMHGFSIHRR